MPLGPKAVELLDPRMSSTICAVVKKLRSLFYGLLIFIFLSRARDSLSDLNSLIFT